MIKAHIESLVFNTKELTGHKKAVKFFYLKILTVIHFNLGGSHFLYQIFLKINYFGITDLGVGVGNGKKFRFTY